MLEVVERKPKQNFIEKPLNSLLLQDPVMKFLKKKNLLYFIVTVFFSISGEWEVVYFYFMFLLYDQRSLHRFK